MQRKLIKVGTSAAVLIPKAVMDDQRMKIGDTIHVEFSKKGTAAHPVIDPEVIQWTDEFIAEYKPLLLKLADS
ncbi:hypothetical protein A3D73_01305 [Candidatus Uhrbacteria bacterium RIFCSPHIGHO2_02_FULL_60_44]|nr:MAG: hypothetical protein A3D73_01305 [Candidatus Uhrbacteria bacterium RIFCSPHIGHO2_02_FULL_60_44]